MKFFVRLIVLLITINGYSQTYRTLTTQTWTNGAWVNLQRETNSIDGSGYLISSLEEEWTATASTWKPDTKKTYTNTTAGLPSRSLAQNWISSGNSWSEGSQKLYTYNSKNKQVSILTQYLNSGTAVNTSLENYSYDTKGFLIELTGKQWLNGTWSLGTKTTYTNNNDGDPVKEHQVSGSMANTQYRTYTYHSPGKPAETIVKLWSGTAWEDFLKGVVTFDMFGFPLLIEIYYWEQGKWVIDSRYNYTNHPDGRMNIVILEGFDGNKWTNSRKQIYEWFTPTGITEYSNGSSLPVIYFDFNGNGVEKQKNMILIEQQGNKRRKVFIAE